MIGSPGPDRDQINALLSIASRVPDHGRLAPWRFIVIEAGTPAAQDLGDKLAEIWKSQNPPNPETAAGDEARMATERGKFNRTPVTIAVIGSPKEHPRVPLVEQILSTGAAAMTLTIAAKAMGFATNWITEWHSFDPEFTKALGLEGEEFIAGFVYIGTATEQPSERERPVLSEIVTYLSEETQTA